ncbi:hypothetical protein B0H19DRAFT_1275586 [Mycena capillaripes]|nr:hypothetical protein B0H19DRAFT_1275586 [Mycena capillaripes]
MCDDKKRRINNTLNRLVALAIQTGSAIVVISTAALVSYLIDEQTNISAGIMYSLGRTYVLSMYSSATDKSNSTMSAIAETIPSEIEMTAIESKSFKTQCVV